MILSLLIAAILLVMAGVWVLMVEAGDVRAAHQAARHRVDNILTTYATPVAAEGVTHGRAKALARSVLGVGVRPIWDSKLTLRMLLFSALCGAVAAWAVLCVVLRLPAWIWLAGTLAGCFVPPQTLLRLEQARLEAKFIDVFPDAIDMIVRMLRAGLPITAAIGVVGAESASPVKEAFASVGAQMSIGIGFDRALLTTGKRVRSADFRFFTVAASLQHATGGNLVETLDILSEIIRKRRAERLKARAVTAEVRTSAYLLGAIPFVVVAGLLLTSPDYLAPLVTDPRGHIIIGMAVGSLLTGFFIMRQMMLSVTRI
jgi:tight adherence protein B